MLGGFGGVGPGRLGEHLLDLRQDPSTRDVLTFVARRIESDPVLLLISTRDLRGDSFDNAGLAQLTLHGLDPDASARLLDAQIDLPADMRGQVLEQAAGNPLALIELPKALASLTPAALSPAWLPLTTRLEQAFAARAATLAPATQALLLVAALDDAESAPECLAAASALTPTEATIGDLAPAIDLMLVSLEADHIRFRHPVIRTAIQQSAGLARRQAAHAALAAVLTLEPDRRLWHLAAATIGADESLAGALEHAATRARHYRDISVAVSAYERAAQLSDQPSGRGHRLLLAAESAFDMGRHDIVTRLLNEADTLKLQPLQRARLSWLHALFRDGVPTEAGALRPFIDIVDRIRREGDTELAMRSLLSLASGARWTGVDEATRSLITQAADALPVAENDPRLLATLAMAGPADRGEAILRMSRTLKADDTTDAEATRLVGLALSTLGAVDESATYFGTAAAGLRLQGRLGLLAQTLISYALAQFARGDWRASESAAQEAQRLAHDTNQPDVDAFAKLITTNVHAVRGTDQVQALTTSIEGIALPLGLRPLLAAAQHTRGLIALASSKHGEAYDQLRRIFDPADPAHHPFVAHMVVADLAEATAGSGRQQASAEIFDRLEQGARTSPSPVLHASLRYARALLAGKDNAEALFHEALATEPSRWPFLHARTLLAWGSWLRRQRRIAESRRPLRAAQDAFDALGARPWQQRVRQELRAAGQPGTPTLPDGPERLTPQELQVAQMAALGLTNREIGERLFLSHRTVGAHLLRVFPKLGITSRNQLAHVLNTKATN